MLLMKDTAAVAAFLRAAPIAERNMLTLVFWLHTILDEIEALGATARRLNAGDHRLLLAESRDAWDVVAQLQAEIVTRQRRGAGQHSFAEDETMPAPSH